MHKRTLVLTLPLMALAMSSTVAAQPEQSPFATMDRLSGAPHIGGSLGLTLITPESDGNIVGFRLDFFGEARVTPRLNAYWQLPFSIATGDGDTETGLGNIEGGVGYIANGPTATIIGRAGLTLPTASNSSGGLAANLVNMLSRLTDISSVTPETIYLRLAGSAIQNTGSVVLRADLGLDVPVSSDLDDVNTLARLNLGASFNAGNLNIGGELVNVLSLGEDGDFSDKIIHTVAFTIAQRHSPRPIYAAFVLPLDDPFLGDAWVITAGIRSAIQ